MDCCYPEDCGVLTVTPMLMSSSYPSKCCEEEPVCYPCLPRCQKVYYCCERKPPKPPQRAAVYGEDYCPAQPRGTVYREECCSPPPALRCCPPLPPPTCCSPRAPRPARQEPCQQPAPPYNECCSPPCKPVKTKYIIPCYRYEDGRIVNKLPVSAFKRNGIQDVEHSKLLGTANFLTRCPQDVSIECDVRVDHVKVADPAKVPPCCVKHALGCGLLKKKPIEANQPTVLTRRACEVACGTRARRKPFVVSSYAADPYSEIRRFHSEDERGNCCFHFERHKPQKCCSPCAPSQPSMSCNECQYVDAVYARPVDSSANCCYYCR